MSRIVLNLMLNLIVAANHSFRNNAQYHPLQFHPVLGFIDAVVAVKDIPKGSEVKLMNLNHCINMYMYLSLNKRFSAIMDMVLTLTMQLGFFLKTLNAPW